MLPSAGLLPATLNPYRDFHVSNTVDYACGLAGETSRNLDITLGNYARLTMRFPRDNEAIRALDLASGRLRWAPTATLKSTFGSSNKCSVARRGIRKDDGSLGLLPLIIR